MENDERTIYFSELLEPIYERYGPTGVLNALGMLTLNERIEFNKVATRLEREQ